MLELTELHVVEVVCPLMNYIISEHVDAQNEQIIYFIIGSRNRAKHVQIIIYDIANIICIRPLQRYVIKIVNLYEIDYIQFKVKYLIPQFLTCLRNEHCCIAI